MALGLYAYGVHEVPQDRRAEIQAPVVARTKTVSEFSRYMRIATNRKVLLFAPTWLAINAVLGLWALQMRFTSFPLHPLGYCAGPMLVWIWLPFTARAMQ